MGITPTQQARFGGFAAARRGAMMEYRSAEVSMSPATLTHAGPANAEIARIFRDVAELLELTGANPFRIRAYRNAARVVEESARSVAAMARSTPKALRELPGIGDDLAGKIEEIVRTGTLPLLEQLEHRAPAGAAELMHVPGIGPRRAKLLSRRLGVRSRAGLARAAKAGRVHAIRGFGRKTEQRILEELATPGAAEHRLLRSRAAQYGEPLVNYMLTCDRVTRAELAGSFRRCRDTVGDLDLLVESDNGRAAVRHFLAYPEVRRVTAHGTTRAAVRLAGGVQVDLRVLPSTSYGSALHYFTGSKAHNIAVRKLGRAAGLKINEYGVFRGTKRIGGGDERDVFDAVGLAWIAPELREARGEIEAARAGTLPTLVELRQIRGDLQMHTTDSDGRASLEEMVDAAEALGYEYVAITDHTPTVRIAGGPDAAGFRRQMRRIDRLNASHRALTILKGVEVDVHADGSLDLDDDVLAAFDIVLVSLHSSLGLASERQTARIVRALCNPFVHVFAHPHARLIGGRRGAVFDLDEVAHVAADQGVLLEINAQPERLDLDDLSARRAQELGATFVIDTDAHSTEELRFMRWGVDQARRGWIERRRVLNTRPLDQVIAFLASRSRA
ncbi:MAG TPA: DNA polymerase/3'-5' exonuclease PolX [Gemmatimonadaceae bacterium]|nr:DNA polymerase/3'-5' exonuclease PolX [Gemmatimonadaceae bacterium]